MEAAHERVRSDSKRLTQELRTQKRAEKRTASRRESRGTCLHETALRVVALGCPAIDAVRSFYAHRWRKGDVSVEDSVEEVVKKFLALDDCRVCELCDPIDAQGKKFLDAAQEFMLQKSLVSWVASQNVEKGVAPGVSVVLAQRDMLADDWRMLSEPVAERPLSRSASYKWVYRWRCRWGLPKGRCGIRDATPLARMRAKAFTLF